MKRCPECSNTFPDSERFCPTDGATLVPVETTERATAKMAPTESDQELRECPVCGGKALPGEEVCSFCGSRLEDTEQPPQPQPTYTPPRQTGVEGSPGPTTQHTFDDERPEAEEPAGFRRLFTWSAYIVAAVVALAAGAWFALHLSHKPSALRPVPISASPAASPAAPVSGPVAILATNTPVQVTGESAADPARDPDAAKKVFESNSESVLDAYKRALAADSGFHDGVLATLTVNPAGDVIAGSIKTSTSPNPALDGDLINTMMGWHFKPFSGSSVEVSYPVVMARNPTERAAVESMLANKIADLNPAETPEYASAPPPAASPAPAPSPAIASREPVAPPAVTAPPPPVEAPRRHRRRREAPALAPRPPHVPLLTRVNNRLRLDRRFNRVKAYTTGGVVTLYGKVFDAKDKRLAVAAIKRVDGVSDVIDNLQTDTATWAQQEALISAQLQNAGLNKVTVKVIGHDAYLDGQVTTEAQKERAVTIAETAAPVRVRTNLIRVVPAGVFGF